MLLCLNERVISSTQHCFRPLQGLDLSGASLLANIEILQEPITFGMQRRDVRHGCHQLFPFSSLVRLVRLQLSFGVCLAGTLLCKALRSIVRFAAESFISCS